MPHIEKTSKPLIWIHAVSVGETKAVAKLARRLKDHFDATLVISNITGTGHQEAKRSLSFADYHVLLPLDFSWTMKRLAQEAKPDLVILTETDFWYHFLKYCQLEGASIALVNGKISERSFHRLKLLPWLAKKLFEPVSLFCVQSQLYADRFLTLGVPTTKIHRFPNLKYDDVPPSVDPASLDEFKARLGILPGDYVIVAGSTHPGEELIVLQAFLKANIPNSKLLIVPRHPERFNAVAELLENEGVKVSRFAQNQKPAQVTLIDTMGILRQCYDIGTIAIVGGSFIPGVGGHNILEPAFFHKPVLFGPHMEGQPDMVDIVLKYRIGKQTNNENLAQELQFSVPDENFIQALGDIQGGVEATFKAITEKCACDKSGCAL
jgi:3-deoxy-D-manno-octulosonic-acid transferase